MVLKVQKINGNSKPCSACSTVKLLSEFWKQSSGPLGYNSRCKSCMRSDRAIRAEELRTGFHNYYVLNKERIGARNRKYKCDNAERLKASRRTESYKNMKSAWDRASYARHADARKRRTRNYALANTEKARAWRRDYKAKKRSAFVESVMAEIVYDRDLGLCQICGLPVEAGEFHLDHRVPISRGGEHSYANCQTSHAVCNIRKSDRLPNDCAHLWARS